MLVVHLVCAAQRQEVGAAAVAQPLDPLVDEHLVHQEVGDAIQQDAQRDPGPRGIRPVLMAQGEEQDRGSGEDQEEQVVAFEGADAPVAVVVLVQYP